jgi:hypothetical protein
MNVVVEHYQGHKKSFDFWRDRVMSALSYYANKLFTETELKDLTIYVNFDKSLSKEKTDGYCECIEAGENPRIFSIGLGTSRQVCIEKVLAHELVHIKQYARNELKELPEEDSSVLWRNEKHIANNEDEDVYFDSPWEIEAYGREVGLYSRYVKYLDPELVIKYGLN